MIKFNIDKKIRLTNVKLGINKILIISPFKINLSYLKFFSKNKDSTKKKNFILNTINSNDKYYLFFRVSYTKLSGLQIVDLEKKSFDNVISLIDGKNDNKLLNIDYEFDHNYRNVNYHLIRIGSSIVNNCVFYINNFDQYEDFDFIPEVLGKKAKFNVVKNGKNLIITRIDIKKGWNFRLRLVLFKQYRQSNPKLNKKIYYTTKNEKKMPKVVKQIIKLNESLTPKYVSSIYSDEKCLKFLKSNFGSKELYCFNKLKPGAFKADLVRLCLLYVYGGVYLDTGMKIIKPIDKLVKKYKLIIVQERDKDGIFNAFISAEKEHPFFLAVIHGIFENVYKNYYGNNQHDVTGPGFLAKFKHLFGDDCLQMRLSKDMLIYYYRDVYIKYMKNDLRLTHNLYRDLWEKKNIYHKHIKYINFDKNKTTKIISSGDLINNFIKVYYDVDQNFSDKIWIPKTMNNLEFSLVINRFMFKLTCNSKSGWNFEIPIKYGNEYNNGKWLEIKLFNKVYDGNSLK